ncbi:N(G),N(G)-dimethylarginine dimethylaminohydrolase 1-like [Branchiostoma floridae]|uniref:N(G),N(G)-dimethylarginine dimethylaminohydrolase 1-like n=1 Tax=Branchiostoma floridae TaxID=7739 RepID=A0A9J7HPQ8_BRAFL|nr:N(G),N(G)-dimethylarginine dimethylaminohydrolase 1-like [Branchiostoma floridae]XP_035661098.1 N(G),N(G)-dimethylarginine dimethylaminohydrolase 1-like [Branchiostoma floridae]
MADIFNFPTYTRAVVREIPSSLNDGLRMDGFDEIADVDKAREEHQCLVQALKDLGLEVTVLPAEDSMPDCAFVEDVCVVLGDRALMTRPADECRRLEVDSVERCMRDLGLEIHRIQDQEATLEGGDVIFTGTEFFVGESTQSNKAGHKILAETFPEFPVHSIYVTPPEVHLKGFSAMAAPGIIALVDSQNGRDGWKEMCAKSDYKYEAIWLSEDCAENCLYVNGTIVHGPERQFPESYKVFTKALADYPRIEVSTEEVYKLSAALTCQCLLF